MAINALNELKMNKLRSIAAPVSATNNSDIEVRNSNTMNELCTQMNEFVLTPARFVPGAQANLTNSDREWDDYPIAEPQESSPTKFLELSNEINEGTPDSSLIPSTSSESADLKAFIKETMRKQQKYFEK